MRTILPIIAKTINQKTKIKKIKTEQKLYDFKAKLKNKIKEEKNKEFVPLTFNKISCDKLSFADKKSEKAQIKESRRKEEIFENVKILGKEKEFVPLKKFSQEIKPHENLENKKILKVRKKAEFKNLDGKKEVSEIAEKKEQINQKTVRSTKSDEVMNLSRKDKVIKDKAIKGVKVGNEGSQEKIYDISKVGKDVKKAELWTSRFTVKADIHEIRENGTETSFVRPEKYVEGKKVNAKIKGEFRIGGSTTETGFVRPEMDAEGKKVNAKIKGKFKMPEMDVKDIKVNTKMKTEFVKIYDFAQYEINPQVIKEKPKFGDEKDKSKHEEKVLNVSNVKQSIKGKDKESNIGFDKKESLKVNKFEDRINTEVQRREDNKFMKVYKEFGENKLFIKEEVKPENKPKIKEIDTDFVKIKVRGEKMVERGMIDIRVGEVKEERVEKFVSRIINEIVEKIKFMISEERKEAFIKLRHDFFGGVEIKIRMMGDKVNMKVILTNPQLKDALQSNIVELKNHLQNYGLDLNEFDIYYKESDKEKTYKPRKFFNFGFDVETVPEKVSYEPVAAGEGLDMWA